MIAALCIDDNRGLRFNRRRQSRDRAVCADLLTQGEGRLLWMEPGSRALFPEEAQTVRTADQPWALAGPEDLCFLELSDPAPALERAEKDFSLVRGWVEAFIANVQDGELRAFVREEWEKKLASVDAANFHLKQLF